MADFAIKHRTISSKDVSHFGLKAAISNQILRKYAKNRKCKEIKSVKLTIPSQSIKLNRDKKIIELPCLKLSFHYFIDRDFQKINQIEINQDYAKAARKPTTLVVG